LALPEDAYSALPFFSDLLWSTKGEVKKTGAVKEAFGVLVDSRFTYDLTPRACNADCAARLFAEGKVPLIVIGEWRLAEMKEALGGKLGVAPLPSLAESGAELRSPKSIYGLFAADDVRESEKAAVEGLLQYARTAGRAHVREALGKVAVPPEPPIQTRTIDDENFAALSSIVAHDTTDVDGPRVGQATDALYPVLAEVQSGRLGANGAAESLVAAAARLTAN
jgi:ABC-type glycerol-3-phosphate transport system substrate-binding protein